MRTNIIAMATRFKLLTSLKMTGIGYKEIPLQVYIASTFFFIVTTLVVKISNKSSNKGIILS